MFGAVETSGKSNVWSLKLSLLTSLRKCDYLGLSGIASSTFFLFFFFNFFHCDVPCVRLQKCDRNKRNSELLIFISLTRGLLPRYTEHSTVDLAQQWDQLDQLAMRMKHNLEQQIQARNTTGVSEETLKEFTIMFK